jgi:hypothetical protein
VRSTDINGLVVEIQNQNMSIRRWHRITAFDPPRKAYRYYITIPAGRRGREFLSDDFRLNSNYTGPLTGRY